MSDSNETRSNSDSENLCVVCCKTVEIYSVGICNHYVCFECSTRMRVLCNQNECPICRAQMPKVIFTKDIRDFSELFAEYQNTQYQDRKYGLIFCSESIKKCYQQLLEFRCAICTKENTNRRCTFYTFQQLKDHMRREHFLLYCELCVENLKIFTFERRCYTKQELGYHRRKGDKDNTSHRGHPLCEFCDTRFMDSDELFRHLRRNHLFCHFCDADGKHQYYNTLDDLRNHFRDEHYLCEEGDCLNMPLTAVFSSNIDLKAHIAIEHGRNLSKSANKQARTLELEFTLAPRPGIAERNKRLAASRQAQYEEEGAVGYDEPGGPPSGPGGGKEINPQDFPALGNSTSGVQHRPTTTVNFTSKLNRFTGDDFPSLGGARAPAVTITTNSVNSRKKAPEVTITRTMRGASSSSQNLAKNAENFPCLGTPSSGTSTLHLSLNNSKMSAPKVSIHVNHNGGVTTTHITSNGGGGCVQRGGDAFPALGGTAAPKNPQWVQQKPKKVEPKVNKVAPAPQLPPSDMSQFPKLSKNEKNLKKSSSVTVPVANWAANTNNNNNNNNSSSNKSKAAGGGEEKASTSAAKLSEEAKAAARSKKNSKKKSNNNNNNNNLLGGGESDESGQPGLVNGSSVKKRSELKIGELSSSGGGSKPPPGFPAKPPPGFSSQEFPSLSNDLTFTSSSGQSYSIKPSNFHQPANFSMRNQNLIKRSMDMLNNNNDMIKDFKSYSALFRNGSLSALEYHSYCKVILAENFNELFPELLVLLPDVAKQQELYQVCEVSTKRNLVVCEKCKQIVFKRELAEHYSFHSLESQFPSLGSDSQVHSNVWKK